LYGRSTDRVIAETNRETEVVKNQNLILRTDLDNEAGKVAGLQKAASDAERLLSEQQGKTAKLDQSAADAKNELAVQQERAARAESQLAGLQKDAADSKAAQQRVEIALENAKAEAAKAIEKEVATRVKLEESLAPRSFSLTPKSIEELKLFPGTKLIICVADDPDAKDLAEYIASMIGTPAILGSAAWRVSLTDQPLDGWFMPGVSLLTRTAGSDKYPRDPAELLTIQLRTDNHIDAVHHGALDVWPRNVPNDVIIMTIGRRPAKYFSDKEREEWIQTLPEAERKRYEDVNNEMEKVDNLMREHDKEERQRIKDRAQRPPN
jgi:hypothetical protein